MESGSVSALTGLMITADAGVPVTLDTDNKSGKSCRYWPTDSLRFQTSLVVSKSHSQFVLYSYIKCVN